MVTKRARRFLYIYICACIYIYIGQCLILVTSFAKGKLVLRVVVLERLR